MLIHFIDIGQVKTFYLLPLKKEHMFENCHSQNSAAWGKCPPRSGPV